jgi:hypothetical protein
MNRSWTVTARSADRDGICTGDVLARAADTVLYPARQNAMPRTGLGTQGCASVDGTERAAHALTCHTHGGY